MKLAEALQERADLKNRLEQISIRIRNNALVQEGEQPAENPAALLGEYNDCIARFEELVAAINRTNSQTVVPGDTRTLTDLIAHRDALKIKIDDYRTFLNDGSRIAPRASRSEIRILGTLDIPALQKTLDALSRDLRLTENKIQETNWTVDLL